MKIKERVDLKTIARSAKVSPATVSKVINNHTDVSESTRNRILAIIQKMNYRPDAVRRAAGQGKSAGERSYRIAVVSPRSLLISFDAFFGEMLKGIAIEIREHGYQLMYELTKDSSALPSCIQERSVEGIVAIGQQIPVRTGTEEAPLIPVVHLDQIPQDSSGDAIIPDYAAGAREAGLALVRAGHRRIAMLYGSTAEGSSCPSSLYRGYQSVFSVNNIEMNPNWLSGDGHTMIRGYEISKRLLSLPPDQRPTAICANDTGSLGVYRAVAELGLRVGADVSVVGCDGLPVSEYLTPALSTIAVDPEQVGREGVKLLIQRLSGKEKGGRRVIYSPVKFIQRDSIQKIG